MFRQFTWRTVVGMWTAAAVLGAYPLWAQSAGSVQGVVKDSSGAPVSGAFVKLKNAEKRLTFMVISQAQGRYTANNLPAGKYVVQGIGGDNQSEPSAAMDVASGRPATVDLSLTGQRAAQLPNSWPGRPPGQGGGEAEGAAARQINLPDGAGKQIVSTKCSVCHDAARIVNARFDRARWTDVVDDMRGYMQGSTKATDLTDSEQSTLLDYLASNFGGSREGRQRPTPDPNSRLPRTLMTGLAAKYIAVEYVLPDAHAEPHEVAADLQGIGWVTQRTGGRLGRLDPKSLVYTELDPPKGQSNKNRLNGIVRAPDGKLWFVDGGPNRRFLSLDPKTREFNQFPLPKLESGSASGNTMRVHPKNGTVWLNSIAASEVIRLDPKTKQFSVFKVPAARDTARGAVPYGMAIDGAGYIWSVEQAPNQMARIDPITGKFDEYKIPLEGAVARKAGMDSAGNIWVGLHGAGKLMKVDYKTQKMTIYSPPTENAGVYSVQGDPKSKYVWMSLQQADKIARFDPTTETFVEFPIPNAESDHRRIEVDPVNPNRIWWSGDTSGRMGYVEVLDR